MHLNNAIVVGLTISCDFLECHVKSVVPELKIPLMSSLEILEDLCRNHPNYMYHASFYCQSSFIFICDVFICDVFETTALPINPEV